MGILRRNKKMIDIREMQRRGIIKIPPTTQQKNVPTNNEGFVDFSQQETTETPQIQSNTSFFGFMDNPTTSNNTTTSNGTNNSSDEIRKISSQLSDLDNKLYKMEQRIEVLEKKSSIGY